MKELLEILSGRLSAGESLALATVVARSGSAPRGAGARMLVGQSGRIWGTVGGGLIEQRAEVLSATALLEKTGVLREFCLNADGIDSIGMVCGGDVTLSIRYLPGGDPAMIALTETALAWLRDGWNGWLVTALEGEGVPLTLLSPADGAAQYPELAAPEGELVLFGDSSETRFAQVLIPLGTVYLFGGGHVARELSPLLERLSFRHVVVDDREAFARAGDFPAAAQVLCTDFAHILEGITPVGSDYAVVMTHGHLFDLAVQQQLLTTPVGYIGVMGSRKKRDFVFAKLRENGFTGADLGRIITPIGLPIGGETPAEIALSIAAQLVQLRAKGGAQSVKNEVETL